MGFSSLRDPFFVLTCFYCRFFGFPVYSSPGENRKRELMVVGNQL